MRDLHSVNRPLSHQPLPQRPKAAQPADELHFSGQNTFLIPDLSDYIVAPGMFGPKASITPLSRNFLSQGLPASVSSFKVPGVGQAQLFRSSTNQLLRQIKHDRVLAAQRNTHLLLSQLKQVGGDAARQRRVIQAFFELDNSPSGRALGKALHGLCYSTPLLDNIASLKLDGNNQDTLNQILTRVRDSLSDALPADSQLGPQQIVDLEEKVLNRVLDRMAPRRVLVGHSLGGVISYKALQEMTGDVAMVVSLGSPLNGTEPFPESAEDALDHLLKTAGPERFVLPPFRNWTHQLSRAISKPMLLGGVDWPFPAIPQLRKGSQSVKKLQNNPTPFDTTAISVANPADGLVRPADAAHNAEKPGHLNLSVSPQEARISDMLDERAVRLMQANPISRWALQQLDEHPAFAGLRQHCGLVGSYPQYWGEQGELLEQVFDSPQAVENLKTLLETHQYEPVREEVLTRMLARLSGGDAARYQQQYAPLKPLLKQIAALPLPFEGSSDKQARQVLARLH